jgi:hypothetical protein
MYLTIAYVANSLISLKLKSSIIGLKSTTKSKIKVAIVTNKFVPLICSFLNRIPISY